MALQAARSVLPALPFPHEVILSDNASSDSTPNLEQALPGVRYIRHPELIPMAEHWNFCVAEAQGKYVKVLCDDDWILPGALEREVAWLEGDPLLSMAASARFEVSSQGNEIVESKGYSESDCRLSNERLTFAMLLGENILGPPSCVTFRSDLFRGFPPGYKYAADWAAWILLAELGGVAFLAEPGANFRLHDTNLTHRHVKEGTDFLEVQALRRECLRRLSGARRVIGTLLFAWIWTYRFTRRLARFFARKEWNEALRFLWRILGYKAPSL